jgi:hypothetical protein
MVECPSENIRPTLAGLHQLTGDVVDGGDVVGVHRMPQAERIGEQARPHQQRIVVKRDESPCPCGHVEQQKRVQPDDFLPQGAAALAEQRFHQMCHGGPLS